MIVASQDDYYILYTMVRRSWIYRIYMPVWIDCICQHRSATPLSAIDLQDTCPRCDALKVDKVKAMLQVRETAVEGNFCEFFGFG